MSQFDHGFGKGPFVAAACVIDPNTGKPFPRAIERVPPLCRRVIELISSNLPITPVPAIRKPTDHHLRLRLQAFHWLQELLNQTRQTPTRCNVSQKEEFSLARLEAAAMKAEKWFCDHKPSKGIPRFPVGILQAMQSAANALENPTAGIAPAPVPTPARARRIKAPSDAKVIFSMGGQQYRIGASRPVSVTPRENAVLQAYLKPDHREIMDLRMLKTRSLVQDAARVLRALRAAYEGIFAPAIEMAGSKGRGGYRVSIRPA